MLRIIVVDDARDDLLLVERILKRCKLLNPVSLFNRGADCMAHVTRAQGAGAQSLPEPAIILVDLVMAPMSGLDVLRSLQGSSYFRHCVVAMLSGMNDIKTINEGYRLGAKTFLLKPVTDDALMDFVTSLTGLVAIEVADGGYLLHWEERVFGGAELSGKTFTAELSRDAL